MEEKRETAPVTGGSAEGERDRERGHDELTAPHTPGSAEGERDDEKKS
jgi:hypothetical protein